MENQKTKERKRSQWLDVWARLKRNRIFMVCMFIIILLILSCVCQSDRAV